MSSYDHHIVSTEPITHETPDSAELVFFEPRVILKYNSNSNGGKSGFSWWRLFSFVTPLVIIGLIGYFGSFSTGHPADPEIAQFTGWALAILTYATLLVTSGLMTLVMWDFHDA